MFITSNKIIDTEMEHILYAHMHRFNQNSSLSNKDKDNELRVFLTDFKLFWTLLNS